MVKDLSCYFCALDAAIRRSYTRIYREHRRATPVEICYQISVCPRCNDMLDKSKRDNDAP